MAVHEDEHSVHSGNAEQLAPTLSVTVLNYNYAHYLPQCLDTILRQTWTDFELLLINDCSTDNSLEVIQPYLADPRVTLINHEQNKGYISSLIEGSDRSRGKYITVISADDFCVSDRAFETLLNMLESDPDISWAHSAYGRYRADGSFQDLAQHHRHSYVRPGSEEYQDILLTRTYILHSGVIIRGSAYKAVGGYNPKARFSCDDAMWLMLCSQGKSGYHAEELYAYRQHGKNMSHTFDHVQNSVREHIDAIDSSFALIRSEPGITTGLYLKGVKKALTIHAEDAIFAGRMRVGWFGFWCAMRIHPVWTIFQSRTPHLVARTLLGEHGFHLLYTGWSSLRHQGRQRVAESS
jgi:glycosyltransferase involved in cell wall biosynthesis